METNSLEKAVIAAFLGDRDLVMRKSAIDFSEVTVAERNSTGVGFLTGLERCDALKLFADGVSLRWGKVGARLNQAKIDTGYLVYVDDGYLTTVEGYTYCGEAWPEQVERIETYELQLGATGNS